VVVDLSRGVFAGGQTYVALSRCTSLEGLVLRSRVTQGDIFLRKEIEQFSRSFNDSKLVEQSLRESEADKLYSDSVKLFKKCNTEDAVNAFASAISKRNDLDKPLVKRFISNTLGKLHNEIASLKAELKSRQEASEEYAHEYYLMGNECITQARDAQAALRCFDKALKLNPTFVDAWVRKGITLLDMEEFYNAQICFNEAVGLSPHSFKARYNRGKCYIQTKNYDEAAADLHRAVTIKPNHATAHDYLAEALEEIGEEELAQKHRDTATSIRKKKK